MLLTSCILGFIPMLFFAGFVSWLDCYEKEPKVLLGGVFLWGMMATGIAFILNTFVKTNLLPYLNLAHQGEQIGRSISAPVIEETLKGLAVTFVYIFARREFDSKLDGLVYGATAGLGFAAAENTLYIYRNGYLEHGLAGLIAQVTLRVIFVGWMHASFTAWTGLGFGVARTSRNMLARLATPLLGFGFAVLTHAAHNSFSGIFGGFKGFLFGLMTDWLGFGVMFFIILGLIYEEYRIMKRHLLGEVASGLISELQYQKALIPLTLSFAGFSGRETLRFYRLLGKLAHMNEQSVKFGEEGGNMNIIRSLRRDIAFLATKAK